MNIPESEDFRTKFELAMGSMSQCVGCCLTGVGEFPMSLVEGLIPEARDTWYPILRRVRDARIICGEHPLYDLVASSWAEFGRAFGLNEVTERGKFEAMQHRMCSWEACAFNSNPSPNPLSVCKGCQEARYCSASCQRKSAQRNLLHHLSLTVRHFSDWKEGGHRLRCRRLREAGVAH